MRASAGEHLVHNRRSSEYFSRLGKIAAVWAQSRGMSRAENILGKVGGNLSSSSLWFIVYDR